jgi:hypothetical protein
MIKVIQSVDGTETELGDFEKLISVAVTGATGTAEYRLDPLQDNVIKLVVVSDVNLVQPPPERLPPDEEVEHPIAGPPESRK